MASPNPFKSIFLSLLLFVSASSIISAQTYSVTFMHEEANTVLMGIKIEEPLLMQSDHSIGFKLKTPLPFTSYAIGWKASSNVHAPGHFDVKVRVYHPRLGWSDFLEDEGYIHPNDNIRNIYLTELIFGLDEWQHDSIEFYIYPPQDVTLDEIHLILQDMSQQTQANEIIYQPEQSGTRSCPEFPSIIPREDWCGSYNACHNPTYSVIYRTPTHCVVHHGASPNTYTDGYAVVRSYWNYHVNSLGWSDIGYNYLFDKYGNFFQGRHNPNLPLQDVNGAHAGLANPYSIGINFLGNADVTLPTSAQIQKCNEFMAWWFDYKGFDPTSSASIYCQDGVTRTLPRICGHKDVNPGGTACPGTTLYGLLSSFRTTTNQIIIDCDTPSDTTAPTSAISINRKWQNSDFEVVFSDEDNPGGSGVKTSFYQVMDYNGTEWRTNAQHGFFNDNFTSAIHPEWTQLSGTWNINSEHLMQSNESLTNPNIFALVVQDSSDIYLYHWQMRISGSGTNRRAGIFFFCSDPAALYRGESYMVYFREETDNVEIYEASGGSISGIVQQATAQINAGQWHDIKITYDPSSGDMNIYIDNKHVLFWKDTTPLKSGNGISFRTGGCIAEYDDMKVYKSRSTSVLVTAGNDASNEARYESASPSQDACRIRTLILDNTHNWSASIATNVFTDFTIPQTTSSLTNQWQTADFLADFIDSDALSGIEKRFYQVLDFDGSRWSANAEQGFFCDVMDVANPDWTIQSGTWNINSGSLVQSDETLGNTNIWAYLKQDLSNRYLYEFNVNIEGSGSNRRAGFHYFCDDPVLTNRGNSYFIWFRLETQKLEFYKVVNDTFNLEKICNINFSEGQWYNIKVVYDRIEGTHFVYLDDVLAGEWDESAPFPQASHANHSYVSFRSGNSLLKINNLKVYRTRYPQVTISMGDPSDMIRFQNPDPFTYASKIKSIVSDSAQNLSVISYHDLNIDWTAPPAIGFLNDGIPGDIDTSFVTNSFSALWQSTDDPHSAVAFYEYAIGTTPGDTDVIGWTINNLDTTMFQTGLSLSPGQIYYVSARAINNAELVSPIVSSDGVLILLAVGMNGYSGFLPSVCPNPASDLIWITGKNSTVQTIKIFNSSGQLLYEEQHILNKPIDVSSFANGVYFINIHSSEEGSFTIMFIKNSGD
jgi:hypothetical protein